MKTLFFDVETTGLDHQKSSIVQLSGIIDIDGKIMETFNYTLRPDEDAVISDEALTVIGKTKEEVMAYEPSSIAFANLTKVFEKYIDVYDRNDKFYPAGYNVRFDLDFLQSFFKKMGNQFGTGSYQNWRAIDVLQLTHYLVYKGKLKLENYKLSTVCAHFGIEINAHDSLSDIVATRDLFYKLSEIL